jgi:hypothetical protein
MTTGKTSIGRRSFLQVAGGSSILAYWLRQSVARAQGATPARRLILIHRPNGSVREDWLRGGQPGPILAPFQDVWPYAVALQGVDVRPSNGSTGGSHESGLLTIMTGGRLGGTYRTNDDYKSTVESLDQTLSKKSAVLGGAKIKTLQSGAHGDQDGGNEIPNITMSYAGAAQPMYPVLKPDDIYKRLFAGIMPGMVTDNALEALTRQRARRQSVLDFVKWDLGRVKSQFPSSFKGDLEAHESAVREAELALEPANPMTPKPVDSACKAPTSVAGLSAGGDHNNIEKVGSAHLKMVVAAFACDITRIVTFQWATGASRASFAPLGTNNHHSTSHANHRGALSAVDKWFSEKTAPFIRDLIATPDPAGGGGKLIDNTLVWYLNEVSEGWNHSFNDYPFVLFGGDNVGLKNRGRVVNVSGQGKTSNDVWSALAPAFGTTLGGFPTKSSGAISGLFT